MLAIYTLDPYIDPMMYVNSSNMQTNPNTMGGYMTYMNPFMNNPFITQVKIDSGMYPGYIDSYDYNDEYNHDDMYTDMMQQQMQPMMPGMIPPNMMQMMMMQMMMCGQMQTYDAWNGSYDALHDDAWNGSNKYGGI